ncbi:tail fiber domain-containing protein [Labilibacter sediminis]|nr:tail fiber domain-containing protein [Labilibacter sediminis]
MTYIKKLKTKQFNRNKRIYNGEVTVGNILSSSPASSIDVSLFPKKSLNEEITGVYDFLSGLTITNKSITYDANNDEILIDSRVRFKGDVVSEGGVIAYADGGDYGSIFDQIPIATKTSKGLVEIGNGINVSDGVISLDQSVITPQTLSLVGNNLSILNGNTVDLSTLQTDLTGYATENWVSTNYSNKSHNHSGVYEPIFSKNSAFNKNFGTTSTTVAYGNHLHTGVYALIGGSGTQDFAANNLTVAGDLTITGTINEVETTIVKSTNDLIITRDGATTALIDGTYTGIQATKYDGTNDGQLVFGSDGFARVGDIDDLQILATREDTPISNGIAYFDNTTKQFKTKTESSLSVAYAQDANTLDGLNSTSFVRTQLKADKSFYDDSIIINWGAGTNVDEIWYDDALNAFNFVADGATWKATANARVNVGTLYEGGTSLSSKYLGISATAAQASKVTVNNHTTNDIDYPIVWHNNVNVLYDSADRFKFNPSKGKLFAQRIMGTATGDNTVPATDQVKVDGYGLIGNRGSVYFTNGAATGDLRFGVGGIHGSNNVMFMNSTGLSIKTGAAPTEALNIAGSAVFTQNADAKYVATFTQNHTTGYGIHINGTTVNSSNSLLRVTSPANDHIFRVESNGRIAINKTGASEALDVNGYGQFTSATTPTVRVKSTTTSEGRFDIVTPDSYGRIAHRQSDHHFLMYISDPNGSRTRFRIKGSGGDILINEGNHGNVGIGTSSTSEKLTVEGSIITSNSGWLKSKSTTGSVVRLLGIEGGNNVYIGGVDGGQTGDVYIRRGGINKIQIGSSLTTLNNDLKVNGYIELTGNLKRSAHNTGHLEGSYNNIGANGSYTNPIYTIGSNYNPNVSLLNNMYGIGYSHADQASFLSSWVTGTKSWGAYFASNGVARIFLDAHYGNIHNTGNINTQGDITIGYTDRATESLLAIRSKSNAGIYLIADTDNVTETHNPFIHFEQDAGGVKGSIGYNDTGKDAMKIAVANATTNSMIFHNQYTSNIEFAINGTRRMYLDNNGKLDVTGTIQGADFYADGATGYSLASGNGRGYRFWNSDSYKIYMSTISDGTWGGRLDTTSDYNMYFRMGGGTNRGWVFDNQSLGIAAQITGEGNIIAKGEVTAFSDRRLKSNIQPLQVRGDLNPVTYVKDGKNSIGFIAQEVRDIYPELVVGEETDDKYLSLNYAQLTAVLYAEIKALKTKINELENKIK